MTIPALHFHAPVRGGAAPPGGPAEAECGEVDMDGEGPWFRGSLRAAASWCGCGAIAPS